MGLGACHVFTFPLASSLCGAVPGTAQSMGLATGVRSRRRLELRPGHFRGLRSRRASAGVGVRLDGGSAAARCGRPRGVSCRRVRPRRLVGGSEQSGPAPHPPELRGGAQSPWHLDPGLRVGASMAAGSGRCRRGLRALCDGRQLGLHPGRLDLPQSVGLGLGAVSLWPLALGRRLWLGLVAEHHLGTGLGGVAAGRELRGVGATASPGLRTFVLRWCDGLELYLLPSIRATLERPARACAGLVPGRPLGGGSRRFRLAPGQSPQLEATLGAEVCGTSAWALSGHGAGPPPVGAARWGIPRGTSASRTRGMARGGSGIPWSTSGRSGQKLEASGFPRFSPPPKLSSP